MRIDIHAHLWSEGYLDLLDSYGRTDTATQRGMGAGETPPSWKRVSRSMIRPGSSIRCCR